jgi:DNA polymerase elongation subunit (family B)
MNEEQMKKMLEELASLRKEQKGKIKDSIKEIKTPGFIVNMDFASLYPSSMTMKFPSKRYVRKQKIKNIFNL